MFGASLKGPFIPDVAAYKFPLRPKILTERSENGEL